MDIAFQFRFVAAPESDHVELDPGQASLDCKGLSQSPAAEVRAVQAGNRPVLDRILGALVCGWCKVVGFSKFYLSRDLRPAQFITSVTEGGLTFK